LEKFPTYSVKVFKQIDQVFDDVATWIRKEKPLAFFKAVNSSSSADYRNCKVIIAGHSYGGYAAVKTAESLNSYPNHVDVDYLVTLDPVPAFRALDPLKFFAPTKLIAMPKIPGNVIESDNFYETTEIVPYVRGRKGFGEQRDTDISAMFRWDKTPLPDDSPTNWVYHMAVVPCSYTVKLSFSDRTDKTKPAVSETWVEHAARL
jgi:pimeloyl-ACP methyl ester carboxylesterase